MTERRADAASYDVQDWLKCEYVQDRVGDEFRGTVTSVTGFGLFVQLADVYVEGLVHITALKNDYYQFDPVRQVLRGEHSGTTYRLGDSVMVKVARVDLDERKIDLQLLDSAGVSVGADNKPRSAGKPGGKSGGKPGGKSGAKSGGKAGGRSTGKSAGKSEGKGRGKGPAKSSSGGKPNKATTSAGKSNKATAPSGLPAKASASAGTLTGAARRDAILAAAPVVNKAKAGKAAGAAGKAAGKAAGGKKPNAKPRSQ